MNLMDFEKIKQSKIAMIEKFKAAYDKAVKEGTITYKKI
nr:MAG TPA: protein of unknown function (DUF5486) [Caudoviricetes sp.]